MTQIIEEQRDSIDNRTKQTRAMNIFEMFLNNVLDTLVGLT